MEGSGGWILAPYPEPGELEPQMAGQNPRTKYRTKDKYLVDQ